MSRAQTAFIVVGIAGAAIASAAIIAFRQTDMGRSAAAPPVPLTERARAVTGDDPAIPPFPALGTRAWIEGPDGTIVARDLPSAAFALEAGQSLDPRIPPGPFAAVLEVTFRPRGDALGRVGAELTGLRMILERTGAEEDLQVDAAGAAPRRSLSGEPVWMRTPVERLDYELARSRDVPVAFRPIREPFAVGRVMPIPSGGRPVIALGPDGEPAPPREAWPAADEPHPVDALVGGLDLGRCTACHAFHARRPLAPAMPGADDLAEAALAASIAELASGMAGCDERARSVGLDVPPLDVPSATGLATLLVQSAGRLPSAEAAAAEAAETAAAAEQEDAEEAAAEDAAEDATGAGDAASDAGTDPDAVPAVPAVPAAPAARASDPPPAEDARP